MRGNDLNSRKGPPVIGGRGVVDIHWAVDRGRCRSRLNPIGVTRLRINPLMYEKLTGHGDSGDRVVPIVADRKHPIASRSA